MKRYLVPILLIILLLSSCATLDNGSGTGEEEEEAVKTLFEDMISSLSSFELSSSDIEPALPSSYTVYSSYLPSYETIKERYLSSVLDIIEEDLLSSFKSNIESSLQLLLDNPSSYIEGTLISSVLKANLYSLILSSFNDVIEAKRSEIDEAFDESRSDFGRIRKSYENLTLLGITVSLPRAEPLDTSLSAELCLEEYFLYLEENEISLRSDPLYSAGAYRLFWSAGK